MVPIFVLMAIAPLFKWQNTQLKFLRRKLIVYLILVCCLAVILPLLVGAKLSVWIFCGIAVALWIVLWTLQHGFTWKGWLQPRRLLKSQWAMILAHLGVGVTVIGIICSTGYSQQRDVSMHPGDMVKVGPYQFQFRGAQSFNGPNYQGLQARVAVFRRDRLLTILYPEQRYFPVAQTATSKGSYRCGGL